MKYVLVNQSERFVFSLSYLQVENRLPPIAATSFATKLCLLKSVQEPSTTDIKTIEDEMTSNTTTEHQQQQQEQHIESGSMESTAIDLRANSGNEIQCKYLQLGDNRTNKCNKS